MAWRDGVSLAHQPASIERKSLCHDIQDIGEFVEKIKDIDPKDR
jgi:hypothetical protein